MNQREFVRAIKVAVYKAAAKGTIDAFRKPAGRRPHPELVELSAWFNGLSAKDQDTCARAVDFAARQATYNFLAVLDGLAAIEPEGPKGKIDLLYEKDGASTRLNDEDANQLTFLFKEPEELS
ncbi:hypothetical protein [Bradyrhizobium sp. LHD-71]|uniref:hypothetical protein n=1 Tax=Bradyrhizobium sp. LHD-71 TaxID=3072141 RepID=UPI00280EE3F5|nr:hypothetical protein [Bradyrhizobium sp. LHD-71]MDQ8727232.1 hypothetical protein [Bradyrhizobium sp. LHD-71]